MALKLPIQATVDRATPLDIFLVPTEVTDSTGRVIEIIEDPVGGPYGPLPADPGNFPASADPRLAVCHILSGYARAQCTRGGGYF